MAITKDETMKAETYQVLERLQKLGFTWDEAQTLRRISMTLTRWFYLECGDSNNWASWAIERDETTDKPYMVTYPHDGKSHRTPISDRETGARKRLSEIMDSRKRRLTAYIQTDPRGCALYILRRRDVRGQDIGSVYTRGVAVY